MICIGGDPNAEEVSENSDVESESNIDSEGYEDLSDDASIDEKSDESDSGDDDDDDDEEEDDDKEEEDDDDDDDDEESLQPVPKNIRMRNSVTDISFSPNSSYLLAAGVLQGLSSSYLELYQNKPGEKANRVLKVKISKKAVRKICFSKDGSKIFGVSKDQTLRIFDTATGVANRILSNIHESNSYSVCTVDDNLVAVGDEDGHVKVWDLRHTNDAAVMSYDITRSGAGGDTVNGMCADDDGRLLFATSNGGIMATFNARQRKLKYHTKRDLSISDVNEQWDPNDQFDNDYSTPQVMKSNSKLVVGTGEGLLHLFNWNEFAASSDSFHNGGPVESMVRVSDDILVTASCDGYIRALNILPNRLIKRLGKMRGGCEANKIVATYDNQYVAASSYDGLIQFFDVQHLNDIEVSDRDKVDKSWKMDKRLNQHRGSKKSLKRRQQAIDEEQARGGKRHAALVSALSSDLVVPTLDEEEDEDDEKDEDEKE